MRKMYANKNAIMSITITLWIVYAFTYVALKNHSTTNLIAGYLSLMGEAGLDLIAAILACYFFINAKVRHVKKIFGLYFLSFVAALLADSIYNIILNLHHISKFSTLTDSFFEVPFAIFLLFQLLAFGNIIISNNNIGSKKNNYFYIPYVIVSLLMFTIFIFGISWKIEHFSFVGVFQFIDTILEVAGFSLAMICLARAKTPTVRFISTGYLFIVSSDFIIRYNVVSGLMPYLNTLEATWVLGILLICIGFSFTNFNEDKKPLELSPINSLQSHIAILILMLWLISALSFLALYYISIPLTEDYLHQINRNLLSIIIPCSVLAIFCSNYISTKISLPLFKLANIISMAMEQKNMEINGTGISNVGNILEFISLENFVLDSALIYKKKHDIEMEFSKTARQVAHDIQSPLYALDNITKNISGISENKRKIMAASISTLTEISENLLVKHRILSGYEYNDNEPSITSENLFSIINDVILEKKIQFKNTKKTIDFISKKSETSLFSLINQTDFKRVISNLINNSVESIENSGLITITLRHDFNNSIIEIKDTGCGIPKEVIEKLEKNKSISRNKKFGNGLGLLHALHCINEWGGIYNIETSENNGTCFSIKLPIKEAPEWIQEEIYLIENQVIVIVDDDISLYHSWKEKLSSYLPELENTKIIYLKNPEELEEFVIENDLVAYSGVNYLFLIDYYYSNSNSTGLDVIEKLNLSRNATLVTSQYPNKKMQDLLKKLNVKLLLKTNLHLAPLNVIYSNPDLVLLDDNILINKTWKLEALKYGKKIVVFNNKFIFNKYINIFNNNTIFYLDSKLGDDRGEDIAKDLHNQGFINLYITTGYDKNEFLTLTYIKGTIGKDPFFMKEIETGGVI